MKSEVTMARVSKRQRASADDKGRRTEAFKWAWSAIEGWGYDGNRWDWKKRIEKAQQLAFWAVEAPLWTAPARKRWPATEGRAA